MRNFRFSSPRWFGRLNAVIRHIAMNSHLDVDYKAENPYLDYRMEVLEVATDIEKDVISRLEAKWTSAVMREQAEKIEFTMAQHRRLIRLGEIDLHRSSYDTDGLEVLLKEIDYTRRARIKVASIIFVIVAAIASFYTYNHPYFRELRKYDEVLEARTISACMEYYSEWPKGPHYEDVMMIELEESYTKLPVIRRYLSKFPEGRFAGEVNAKYDTLWDYEICQYEKGDSLATPEASAFMKDMLAYMKKNRIHEIKLVVKPELKLKDFHDYSPSVVKFYESFNSSHLEGFIYSNNLPIKGNVVSVKNVLNRSMMMKLDALLTGDVIMGIDKMFTDSFVTVSGLVDDPKAPVLEIRYTIHTQERMLSGDRAPSLWVHYTNSLLMHGKKNVKEYLPGVDMNFELDFSIPDTDKSYVYKEKGLPGTDEISKVDDSEEAYRIMTQRCFDDFSKKMIKNIGLRL